jgi:hypothetical protein
MTFYLLLVVIYYRMRTSSITHTETPSVKPVSLFRKAKNELSRLRKTILRELSRCKETGKLVGIKALTLGDGMVLSSVEDIYREGSNEVIVVKWYDRNNIASKTHVFIDEILSVQPMDKMKRNSLSSIS